MKLSKAFEGKDSSLRKAFENTKEEVLGFRPSIDVEIDVIIKDSKKVKTKCGRVTVRNKESERWLRDTLNDIYARGFNDGAYEQRMLMEEK
jgi:hypothetical protein